MIRCVRCGVERKSCLGLWQHYCRVHAEEYGFHWRSEMKRDFMNVYKLVCGCE